MSTAEAPRAPARRVLGALGALLSVAILVAIVVWALDQEPPRLPSTPGDLAELGLAIVLYFLSCAVRGERWQVLLRENGASPRRADTYSLIAVGYLGNNVLPARAGDALRVVLLTPRAQTDTRTVIGTLVAERLCDVLILGLLFAVLTYGAVSGDGIVDLSGRIEFVAAAAAIAVALLAITAAVLRARGHLARVWAFVAPMVAATRNLRGRHGAEVLVLSVVVWAIEGGVWWSTAQAADLGISPIEALYVLALSSMMVLIPAGPGYAGTLDAAVLLAAKALGKASSAALSYLILLRFVLMVPITIAGLVLGAARFGGLHRVLGARRGP